MPAIEDKRAGISKKKMSFIILNIPCLRNTLIFDLPLIELGLKWVHLLNPGSNPKDMLKVRNNNLQFPEKEIMFFS